MQPLPQKFIDILQEYRQIQGLPNGSDTTSLLPKTRRELGDLWAIFFRTKNPGKHLDHDALVRTLRELYNGYLSEGVLNAQISLREQEDLNATFLEQHFNEVMEQFHFPAYFWEGSVQLNCEFCDKLVPRLETALHWMLEHLSDRAFHSPYEHVGHGCDDVSPCVRKYFQDKAKIQGWTCTKVGDIASSFPNCYLCQEITNDIGPQTQQLHMEWVRHSLCGYDEECKMLLGYAEQNELGGAAVPPTITSLRLQLHQRWCRQWFGFPLIPLLRLHPSTYPDEDEQNWTLHCEVIGEWCRGWNG